MKQLILLIFILFLIGACAGTTDLILQTVQSGSIAPIFGLDVEPNAYGLGVNQDQYGRAKEYRLRDGRRLPSIFSEDVERDAYGPGVHSDPFGRPVYDTIK